MKVTFRTHSISPGDHRSSRGSGPAVPGDHRSSRGSGPAVPDEVLATMGLGGSARQLSASVFHPSSGRPDCVAGHVRLELRNVVAKYPFERSPGFPETQPISGYRDYSRLSCGVVIRSSGLVLPGSSVLRTLRCTFIAKGACVVVTDPEPDRLPPHGPASACRPPRGFGGGGARLRQPWRNAAPAPMNARSVRFPSANLREPRRALDCERFKIKAR
jgi:hypothetical protein